MTALYAYAIVPASLDVDEAPEGVDGGPVQLERLGDLAALVSPLDASAYHPDAVAANSQDVDWLGARAAAHDRVLTWAIDHATTIPLPIFSLFRDRQSVQTMLRDHAPDLRRTLAELGDAREYTVRVFRLDGELAPLLAAHDPEIARLEKRTAEASPGQRYLLDRKLEQARRDTLQRVGEDSAEAICAELTSVAHAVARDAVAPRATGASGQAVLNASFLVGADRVEAFRAEVTRLIAEHGGRGFRFEFTGPWAPYHFVRAPRSDSLSASPSR